VRTTAVRALEGEAPASASEDSEQPRATELAAQCPNAVGEMRRVLRRQGWAVPSERYAFEDDGPELMRCAVNVAVVEQRSPQLPDMNSLICAAGPRLSRRLTRSSSCTRCYWLPLAFGKHDDLCS